MGISRVRRSIVIATTCLVALAACGDDDDSSSSSTTAAAATSAASETTAAGSPTTAAAEPATGEPIKIMVEGGFELAGLIGMAEGAQAAAESINARGGINGRPIEVVTCDDKNDPNEMQKCAARLEDEGIVAMVGSIPAIDSITEILEEKGIPFLAPYAVHPKHFTSPISFPLMGSPAYNAGLGKVLVDEGATKVSIVNYEGLPSEQLSAQFVERGITSNGGEVGTKLGIPFGAQDVSAQVSQVTGSGSDGVALTLTEAELTKWLQASQQLGADLKTAILQYGLSDSTLDRLGSVAEGAYVVGAYPPLDADLPAMQEFRADMEKYQPGKTIYEWTLNAWEGVQLFAKVAEQLDEITPATVLEALQQVDGLDLGLLPPISFVEEGDIPDMPRLFNHMVFVSTVEDGKLVPLSPEPIDSLSGS